MNISTSNKVKISSLLYIMILFVSGISVTFAFWNFRTLFPKEAASLNSCPSRIVSVAPSVTECLFAIGCEDRVAGVTQFCRYPQQAAALPKIGGLINPNFEKVLSLRPDIVIYQGNNFKIEQFCKAQNIPTLQLQFNNVETIKSDIILLGETLSTEDNAQQVIREIDTVIKSMKDKIAGRKRKQVFLCLSRLSGSMTNLTTAGSKTFISEVIEMAGGENIFADLPQDYAEINKEALLKRKPEIIIEFHPGKNLSTRAIQSLKNDWADMPSLNLDPAKDIHILTDDYLLMPTPRLSLTLKKLASTINPELFD